MMQSRRWARVNQGLDHRETVYMSWKAPKVTELALGAEINSYACAEAKK
jgi:coenzyme PQQ precursor peptide PqqA